MSEKDITVRLVFEPDPIVAQAVHIDTIKLSHAYLRDDLPSIEELMRRNFEINYKERGGNKITNAYLRPASKKSTQPNLTITISEFGYSGISVEVSIAKLINRNGLGKQTNDDIESAFDAIEDFIRTRTGVEFDAKTAKVSRFDANADFLVGEHQIIPFINSISCNDSRFIGGTVGSTTKQYFNKGRTLIAYGKKSQMEGEYKKGRAIIEDVEAAEGLLRIESRLSNRQAVKRFADSYSMPNEANYLLTRGLAFALVENALKLINLDTSKPNKAGLYEKLKREFPDDVPEILGIIKLREEFGEDFWKWLGWSKSTYYRKKKLLKAAKLWDLFPYVDLPALLLPSPIITSLDSQP
ncbi:MAG TPA: hypothetical protein VEX70_03810 [Pyrinomonadaceae bacterium]|nr:hypothetical protein [Pyrinomonadaceae bacterium]